MNVTQEYKGIKLELIDRSGYEKRKAKRFLILPFSQDPSFKDNQNVWIPNKHLDENGIILSRTNIDYIFRFSQRQLELAGYLHPIIGIKRRS